VVLGESGEAIMGSGIVRRFRYAGVLCNSGTDAEDVEVILGGTLRKDVELMVVFDETLSRVIDCKLDLGTSRVGLKLL
jgi:hypothetical protein